MILSAMLLIFSACKEDDPVDPCTNGFLDPGETAPDCGGDCPPCSTTPVSFLTLYVNGVSTSMQNRELDYDGNSWSLQFSNDSLNVQIGYGTTGAIGTYPIDAAGSFLYKNGTQYLGQTEGVYSISDHDVSNNLMSGFFQIKFFRPGFVDTLHITGGQFENFSY
jgi:hypothetical protein